MRKVKTLKKWGIYELNAKEEKEYGFKYAPIHPDNMECYSGMLEPSDADMECETLEQAIQWVMNY